MRVLFLINSSTGLFGFRKEVVQAFVSKGIEVFFCAPDDGFIPELNDIGTKYIPVVLDRHGKNPLRELQLIRNYKRIIRQIRPDLILTYTIKPNVYGGLVAQKLKVPYIANVTGLGTAVEYPGFLRPFAMMLYRMGLKNARTVFFQNSDNLDFMIKHRIVSQQKTHLQLIPGSGVNIDYYVPSEYPKSTSLYFVSRVMKEKGIEQFLEMASAIKKEQPDVQFHVCGDCEQDYKSILSDLEKQKIIVYHGNVKDMRKEYSQASCVILPTFYPEGLSNVLLESSASARPIITTNRAGCREVIEDGKNGFVVMAQSTDDLIAKVRQFLLLSWDEKKRMGLYGRAKVEKEFNRQIIVNAYLEEVAELVESK